MRINVAIQLGNVEDADTIGKSAQEIATDVLAACNGDPEKDICQVQIMDVGTVGTPPMAPIPAPIPAPTPAPTPPPE